MRGKFIYLNQFNGIIAVLVSRKEALYHVALFSLLLATNIQQSKISDG